MKITHELLKRIYQTGNEYETLLLRDTVLLNDDGTNKARCFYINRKMNNRHLTFEDIVYLFDISLWSSLIKWATTENENDIHDKFINYVWIKVSNLYLDEMFYKRFGNGRVDSVDKLEALKQMNNVVYIDENDFNENLILGLQVGDDHHKYMESVDTYQFVLQSNIKQRWKRVLSFVTDGFKISEIASLTGVSKMTIRNDVKHLTSLFENLNSM